MTPADSSLLCYGEEADDRFRTYYVDLGGREFSSPDATGVLDRLIQEDFPQKLEMLDGLFSTQLRGTRTVVSRMNAPDVAAVFDVRYEGRPNTRDLYDILFLPGFNNPAYKLSLSIDGDHVRKLDWFVYTAREFSAIDAHLYQHRFRILAHDRAAARLSNIEILKDRLSPDGFDEWLRTTRFHDEIPKRVRR